MSLAAFAYKPTRWGKVTMVRRRYGAEVVGYQKDCVFPWMACMIDGVLYVTIQGTSAMRHWKSNLSIESIPILDGSLEAHEGAVRSAERIAGPLRRVLEVVRPSSVSLVGHSMGGALAHVLALYMASEAVPVQDVYSFGAPAVFRTPGILSREPLIKAGLDPDRFNNVVLGLDPVPRCLPFLGYNFLGTLVALQAPRDRGYHPALPPKSGAFRFQEGDDVESFILDPHPMAFTFHIQKVMDYHATLSYVHALRI